MGLQGLRAARAASHGKSRRPCVILYMQMRSPRILLRLRKRYTACGELTQKQRNIALARTSQQVSDRLQKLGNSSRKNAQCQYCAFKVQANKHFIQGVKTSSVRVRKQRYRKAIYNELLRSHRPSYFRCKFRRP